MPTKTKKRTWFWAECGDCPEWRSAAVQTRERAQKAADAHRERFQRRGRSSRANGQYIPGVAHAAVVVNPEDG